jgi:phospholipase/carboxylesterase
MAAAEARLPGLAAALLGLMLTACASVAPAPAHAASASVAFPILSARPASSTTDARAGLSRLTEGTSAALYVPPTYRADHPAAFVLLLHGATGRGADMIEMFRHEADARGLILLAPDSTGESWDVVTSFVHGRSTGAAPAYGADVERIDAALSQAFARYTVDPARVAVLGVSDGAGYALALGINNATLFRSIVALSPGFMMPIAGKARSRIFIAHGRSDRMLPVEATTGEFVPALRGAGFDVDLLLYNGGHEWPRPVITQALDWYLGKPG